MKHKHDWHFLRVYFKYPFSVFSGKQIEKRYATFHCSECGTLKEIEVKEVKNG
jgi:hypothetical protein